MSVKLGEDHSAIVDKAHHCRHVLTQYRQQVRVASHQQILKLCQGLLNDRINNLRIDLEVVGRHGRIAELKAVVHEQTVKIERDHVGVFQYVFVYRHGIDKRTVGAVQVDENGEAATTDYQYVVPADVGAWYRYVVVARPANHEIGSVQGKFLHDDPIAHQL